MSNRFFLSFILFCSFSLFSQLHAQAWDSLPLPTSNISVATLHNGAIFVANGNHLGLFRSTDQAAHWEQLTDIPTGQITSITSIDSHLYTRILQENAVDKVYRSVDNGNTWSLLVATTPSLTSTYRQDTVFRAFFSGVVVRYLPGGISDTVFSDNTRPINRLLNIGTELWMVRPGQIWHSANGIQWYLLPTPPPAYQLTAVHYLQNAVFFIGNGNIYRSVDHGATWNLVSMPVDLQGNLWSITNVNGTLYAGMFQGLDGYFIRSVDAGATWTLAYKGIRPILQWLVDGPIWVIRTDMGLLESSNNGQTWWDANRGLPDNYAYDYCRLENGVRLCNSASQSLFRSTDEGQSWEYLMQQGEGSFAVYHNKVAFLNYDSLFVSTNNGTTWSTMPDALSQGTKGIWVDDTHLMHISYGTPDYPSICDLNTQSCQSIYPIANAVVSQGRIFAVTYEMFNHQDIVRSDDAGLTWTVVGAGTTPPWAGYAHRLFATDSVVILRTLGGKIFTSRDNGDSWQVSGAGLPEVEDVFWGNVWGGWGRHIAVVFADSPDGQGYVSDDYGENWTAVYSPAPPNQRVYSSSSAEGMYYMRVFEGTLQTVPGPPMPPGRLLRFTNFSENAVRGLVFNDQNNNGLRDAGEAALPNVPVWLKRSGTIAATDAQGHFSILPAANALPDTLTIEPFGSLDDLLPAYYVIDGPANSRNFGMHFDDDVAININSGSDPRPGYLQHLVISCQNTGTVPQSGMLKLLLDPQLMYKHTPNDTLPTPTVSGDTLIWNLGTLQPFQNASFSVFVGVDSAAMFGDTLRSVAILCLDMPDLLASNDRDTLTQAVVASFDPNDKAVAEGERISLAQATARKDLHYRVRFQNTGNFPAVRVVIRDTLSTNLDAASIRLLSASHSCRMVLSETNIVEFQFDPIYLPDSISNEPESHGFVEFSVKPKSNLVLGDSFENTAFIYFDANLPVKTNTVQTVISEVSAASIVYLPSEILHLTPNPTNSELTINLPGLAGTYDIKVFDALGRMVLEQQNASSWPFTLSVANLQHGLHWVVVTGQHFKSIGKFVR